jgi:prophage antirepressor-like protein
MYVYDKTLNRFSIKMEVIRAFENNTFNVDVMIRGTYENPLFRASDVGAVLEMPRIRSCISEYSSQDKVILPINTIGGMQQVTFLTEKGLYKLLHHSRKPIALKFQDWIHDVIHEIRTRGHYILQEDLAETKRQLSEVNTKLTAVNTKLVERKVLKFDLKERVYIVEDKNSDGEPVFKFGKSVDMTTRMKTYTSSRYDNGYRDCVVCSDSKALEDLVHYVLRSHADVHRKDWIFVPYEVMKATLDTCRDFLDRMIKPNMTFDEMNARLRDVQASMCVGDTGDTATNDTNDEEGSSEDNGPDTRTPKECVDQFFKEQVIVNESSICAVTDISATYRIWRKMAASKAEWKLFYKYIRDHFKQCRSYDPELTRKQLSYRGIELKPFEYYTPLKNDDDDDNENRYDEFIQDMCIVGVNKRIPTSRLLDAWIDWKKNHGMSIGIAERERRKLQAHLRATGFVVMMSTFHDCSRGNAKGVVDEIGAYGITLRSCPDDYERHVGQSINKRKKVYEVDVATNTVVKVYESMTIANAEVNIDIDYRIRTESVFDGKRWTYDPTLPWTPREAKRMGRPPKSSSVHAIDMAAYPQRCVQ